jgi:hypothetical protein
LLLLATRVTRRSFAIAAASSSTATCAPSVWRVLRLYPTTARRHVSAPRRRPPHTSPPITFDGPTLARVVRVTRGSRDAHGAREQRHMISSSNQQPQVYASRSDNGTSDNKTFPEYSPRPARDRSRRGDRQPCAEHRVFRTVDRDHALAGQVAGACSREKAGILGCLRDCQSQRAGVGGLRILPVLVRERVLFIGTQFSILYTSMYSPAEAATPRA